jgi:hypothetical protein
MTQDRNFLKNMKISQYDPEPDKSMAELLRVELARTNTRHEIELEDLRAEIMLDAERIRERDTTIRALKRKIENIHIVYLVFATLWSAVSLWRVDQ